ncbi:glutathione S-transferase D1 [Lasioglossum baleicum]|uniref:glutathione S-transferase D1 n=1 Tax=Lasioglossum baleicum TaxID=434251 RepID=UPI003FCD0F03
MTIDFYQMPTSSPCRAVALTAAAIGLQLNPKNVNLMAGEHLKPEYLKINPQHTIPTINDNGLCLWESRAIMTYLINQYAKDDTLYPKDAKKRALVDQRLYFDACTLYKSLADYYYPVFFYKQPTDPEKYATIEKAVGFLEKFLENETYVAGKTMTVADLSILATVTSLDACGFDLSTYKNTLRWLANMKSVAPKYEEANGVGVQAFKKFVAGLKQ